MFHPHPKTGFPASLASGRPAPTQRGVALVLVLSFLVLTVAVVLIFFSSVSLERTASASYANQTTTQQLAESTVQTVIGTIKQATTPPTPSAHIGWASQPGMIRVYGDGSGSVATAADLSLADYKLYSSDNTVVTMNQMPFDPTAEVPASWYSNPAFYTDLNSPVSILDPSTNTSVPIYPIVDPGAQSTDGSSGVEGFFINQAPVSTTGTTPNTVPMPVKWIYVLKDGTFTAPDSGSGSVAQWTSSTAAKTPSTTNPIVGRVAYWTDDETCKVNINTASEGNAWDVPRSESPQDINYALIQPLQHEYQRYPGHPATTSLSSVFNGLGLPLAFSPFPAAPFGADAQPASHVSSAMVSAFQSMQPYYALAARVADGGSQAGTGTPSANPAPVPSKTDRLYASVDELLFKAPTSSVPSRTAQAPLTKAELEKAKFFITTNSRAPDVTLFDTPKVTAWPEWDDADAGKRTAFDKLIAFCSSIGCYNGDTTKPYEYYFARQNPRSSTVDYNLSDSGGANRNQKLYTYLQALTGRQVPGFGGGTAGFLTKYPMGANASDRDQILTSIYDYIRSTNLGDVSTNATPFTPVINNIIDPSNTYSMTMPINASMLGGGEVIPIKIGVTQGFGRAATIAEAGIIFYATNPQPSSTSNPPTSCQVGAIFVASLGTPMQGHTGHVPNISMQVTGLQSMKVSSALFTTAQPASALVPLGFASGGTTYSEGSDMASRLGMAQGGYEDFQFWLTSYLGTKGCNTAGGNAINNYPFFAVANPMTTYNPTPANGTPLTFSFSGGSVTITLSACQSTSTPEALGPAQTYSPYQTLQLSFPPATLALPTYNSAYVAKNNFDASNFNSRIANAAALYDGNLIVAEDTVISLQPAGVLGIANGGTDHSGGDYRMYAALPMVPSTYLRPSLRYNQLAGAGGNYNSQSYFFMTAGGNDTSAPQSQVGTLIIPDFTTRPEDPGIFPGSWTTQNFPWKESRNAAVPSLVGPPSQSYVARSNSLGQGAADWDFGYGCFPDGPYINKTDDGNGWNGALTNGSVIPDIEDMWYLDSRNGNCFSPNRQVPSSMMFGSIPTGIQHFQPWQTLLFHARPDDYGHPGFGVTSLGSASASLPPYLQQAPYTTLPDHLIADNFWMPIVEPYAISEAFSTAGKINMNYQIVPFTYIHRDTSVRAVMKNVNFAAFAASDYPSYKNELQGGSDLSQRAVGLPNRYTINLQPALLPQGTVIGNTSTNANIPPTLREFEARFYNNKDLFRSPTEISDIDFVPTGTSSPSQMSSFWKSHLLTGTNLRDKPYVDTYPRLTTKSNTYTVHLQVQTLHKVPSSNPAQWTEGKDVVLSEYRGSSTIERYVDADDTSLPDFASAFASDPTVTLNSYPDPSNSANRIGAYKFRVLTTKQFSP